jgi:hypothetical protein
MISPPARAASCPPERGCGPGRSKPNGETMTAATVATAILSPPNDLPAEVLVQVWFGSHLISDWTGPADAGQRLAARQRLDYSQKCTVVCEPIQPAWGRSAEQRAKAARR